MLVHTCLHQSMHSSSRNPLSEHLLSLAMAELHNERSLPTERRLYDSYQAAVTMRGELDDLYACISGLRRDMRKLQAIIHPEIVDLHERLDDAVSSMQTLVHVCFAHARATEGIIRYRPVERPPYERRLRSRADCNRSRSRSPNGQQLHTVP